jgi:hypothetical protein
MKVYRGEEIQLHSFLTSAPDGDEWSMSRPDRFTIGNELRHPLNRSLGRPRAGVDVSEKRKVKINPLKTKCVCFI